MDALGINLSDVGMCLFTIANFQWDRKLRSNFFRPERRNLSEFPGLFAIAHSIYTESSFCSIPINSTVAGWM